MSEQGSYLGIPLVLLCIFCVGRYRRDRCRVLLAAGLAVIAYVLSLGPTLVIAAHRTSFPLPFDAIGRLRLLNDILPARFALYQSFFAALVIALGVSTRLAVMTGTRETGACDRDHQGDLERAFISERRPRDAWPSSPS